MTTDYPAPRPVSEQLVDLHVYLLPREEWSEKYSSTYVESIDKALSAGFVRVWPDLTVSGLRMLIENELGYDVIPRSYVFLKSVGSRMTQVKPKQELELKCKAFLPPTAWAPEIVVLEVPRDSMSVPVYQSFPGYSPRHDATQPINGIPTHFPQVANHDRIAQQDGLDLDQGSKVALEAIKEKAQDKTKKAKSKDPNLKDGKASRLSKKAEAKVAVNNKKTAGNKAIQSKAGLERTKRLKQTQAAWSKEAKRPKVQEKERPSVGSVRDSRGRNLETGLEKDTKEGRGQVKSSKKTYIGGRRGGKIGQEPLGTMARPQGKVIEVLPPIKADLRQGMLHQDRIVQTSDIYIGIPSQHNTHSSLVPGDSPTIPSTSFPGQRLPSSNQPNPFLPLNANLTNNNTVASAPHASNNHPVANPDSASKRLDNPNTSTNNSASFKTVQPLPHIAHRPDVLLVKSHSRSQPGQSSFENSKKPHPISSNYPGGPTNIQSDDDTNQVNDVASPTNNRTTHNSLGEDVNHDTTPATSGHHHTNNTNNLHHHDHYHNIHQSGSRRLSNNDSVPFPAPLSATPPDTPTSGTPPPGQSPMMQQQQGYKSDPLQSMMGNPGKSGRPDAYTNNTNEDSGIAEPTPDDEDTDYDRRKSEIDDEQYYNQLHSNQRKNEQFQQEYEEKELEEERQRQAEIQEREEQRRRDEERVLIEAEKQREEERREHERKLEQKKQEDAKKQRQREMEKKWEEERRKEEEEMREEQKRKEEAERDRASAYDGAIPLEGEDDDYDDAAIAMETNHAHDGRGRFLDDEQMKRRAEDELRDYEPQSTWQRDGGGEGGGEMSRLAHPGRKSRSREDTEMEIASQQAVQDGLKRVHLTPEVHRKAKIGKIRNSSVTDEEDIYETDPEMAGLMEQLQLARQERMKKEKERESLIKKARDLQTKTYERRNRSLHETRPRSSSITPDQATHPRDYWKKRYYDEKKKTAPFEDQISRMRNQLELMHRKLLNHLEGKKKGVKVKGPPSKKNDHKINILKMQHELDELKRKVDNARMKLTSEIKLRNQAEAEVRGLKSEVTQRKINMTLIRNQKLAALKTGDKNLLSKTPIPALGQGHMSFSAKR